MEIKKKTYSYFPILESKVVSIRSITFVDRQLLLVALQLQNLKKLQVRKGDAEISTGNLGYTTFSSTIA